MEFKRRFVGYGGRKKYPAEDSTTVVTMGGGSTYTIIGSTGGETTGSTTSTTIDAYTKSETDTLLNNKQDTLVSGSNIKTVNGASLLGSGNISIESSSIDAYTKSQTDSLLAAKQNVLVSGSNIKTINGESILGGGDISIQGSNLVITPVADDLFDYTYLPKVGIGLKEVAKVVNGDTTFYLSSIDREDYKICLYKQPAHTRADFPITGLPQDLLIRFENYDTRLEGNSSYRLCLMEWRRDKKKCWHWSIPMITPRWDSVTGVITNPNTPSRYAFEETFCPVVGQETKMFGNVSGKTWVDILPLDTVTYEYDNEIRYRFKNGRSNRTFGFALFRLFEPNTEGYVGRYEWARVSNIAKFKVTVSGVGKVKARVLD